MDGSCVFVTVLSSRQPAGPLCCLLTKEACEGGSQRALGPFPGIQDKEVLQGSSALRAVPLRSWSGWGHVKEFDMLVALVLTKHFAWKT
jgi:hypothetical protein